MGKKTDGYLQNECKGIVTEENKSKNLNKYLVNLITLIFYKNWSIKITIGSNKFEELLLKIIMNPIIIPLWQEVYL